VLKVLFASFFQLSDQLRPPVIFINKFYWSFEGGHFKRLTSAWVALALARTTFKAYRRCRHDALIFGFPSAIGSWQSAIQWQVAQTFLFPPSDFSRPIFHFVPSTFQFITGEKDGYSIARYAFHAHSTIKMSIDSRTIKINDIHLLWA